MERSNIDNRPPKTPGPGTHSVAGTRFCECCGNRLSSNVKFCANCGTQVGGTQTGRQPSPQQQQPTQSNAQSEMVEQYQINIERLGKLLNYRNDLERSYGQRGRNRITQAFEIIHAQMDQLVREVQVTPSRQEIELIQDATDMMLRAAVNGPITGFVRNLSMEMGVLIHNWSRQTVKLQTIESKIQAMDRIVRLELTCEDAIMVLRTLIERAQGTLRYQPASIELSKHYLKSLEDDK